MIKKVIKHRIVEIIGVLINLILISKYFFDKLTIRCEPCLDKNDCPPCQTDFMKYFWIYLLSFNLLIIFGLIMKRKK